MIKIFRLITLLSVFLSVVSGCGNVSTDEPFIDGSVNKKTPGTNLSGSLLDSSNPVISADEDGNIYVAWEEAISSLSSDRELYLAKSIDSGVSFLSNENLSNSSKSKCSRTGSSQSGIRIITGGSAYLTWIDSWKPSQDVSEIKFIHEGSSCASISTTFSATPGNAFSPYISSPEAGKVHIIWAEAVGGGNKEISYVRSNDNGTTFQPADSPLNLSNTSTDSSGPMIAFESPLHVDAVWVEGTSPDRGISFSRSVDAGISFSPPQTVSVEGTDSYCPAIAVYEEGKIYIAYKGGNRIYFTRWQTGSNSFSTPQSLYSNSVSPSCPQIALGANGIIYVVWSDSGGIWLSISTDRGYSFAPSKDLSFFLGASTSPRIAVDGSHVNLIWIEEDIGDGDIFFSASRDNGKNFSSPINLTDSSSPSHSPVLASDGGFYIHIAWVEGEAGKGEIYYMRNEGARGITPPEERTLSRFLDISGDAQGDILIGAPHAVNTGQAYVFYSSHVQSIMMSPNAEITSANLTFSEGSDGDQFGYSVAIAGDVNGDGYSDILVGAPYADNAATDNGKVFLYMGGQASVIDAAMDIEITGSESSDQFGIAVSPAGDVNGDGFDDILIGAPNKHLAGVPSVGLVYLFYGGPYLADKPGYPSLSAADADVIFSGESVGDQFGSALSRAGDIDADGFDDIIIGAPLATDAGNTVGRVYIYYGSPNMDASAGITISGEAILDQFGSSVAGGGDVNGDEFGDIIIGAPHADVISPGDDMGVVYIIYGSKSLGPSLDLSTAGDSITKLNSSIDLELFGTSVSFAGDVNKDGFNDILVGSGYMGADPFYKGQAYLYLGGSPLDMNPHVLFSGDNQEDSFGKSVAGAGDVNGDGHADLLVSAYLADSSGGGVDRGKVYLFTGSTVTNNTADIIFTGVEDNGWAGFSLY